MAWIPIAAWAFAIALALVVLGFTTYEIWWKAARLSADVGRLNAVRDTLTGMQSDLAALQERIARLPTYGSEPNRPPARGPAR